jgi:hypothetical protein
MLLMMFSPSINDVSAALEVSIWRTRTYYVFGAMMHCRCTTSMSFSPSSVWIATCLMFHPAFGTNVMRPKRPSSKQSGMYSILIMQIKSKSQQMRWPSTEQRKPLHFVTACSAYPTSQWQAKRSWKFSQTSYASCLLVIRPRCELWCRGFHSSATHTLSGTSRVAAQFLFHFVQDCAKLQGNYIS